MTLLYREYILNTIEVLEKMSSQSDQLDATLSIMSECYAGGGILYFCGNGGSAADAQHWAAEFVGRFRISGRPLGALALTTNTSILTSIANDFSFDDVFARQVEATGRSGDVLCAITTSGNSQSVINAAIAARKIGMRVIGFTGESGGSISAHCDLVLRVPSVETEVIQHAHVTLGHFLAGELERMHRPRSQQ